MSLLRHFPAIDEVEGAGREDGANRDLLAGLCRKLQHCRRYDVVAFGDDPEMITELTALVVSGRKRATCSLARDYANPPATLPKVGDFVVVVDGQGKHQCIYRTTQIEVKPLIVVDDQFAWDEGEGDRSRDSWLDDHRDEREGFEMHDMIEAVFERFEIVWPARSDTRDY
jgi:uncharacterized protein YhfF